jgi:general stress protein 26
MTKRRKEKRVAIFEGKKVRRHWDEKEEKWYFHVVDVVEILTDSSIPKRYWSDLKRKLAEEGSQVYESIVQLKFMANDGKYYSSDAGDTETIFRIIQSIPSPKTEKFQKFESEKKIGAEKINLL